MKRSNLYAKLGIYVIYILVSVFFLYPIVWVFTYSFKTLPELLSVPPRLLPRSIQLDNYRYVIYNTKLLTNIWNSVKLVCSGMVLTIAVSLPAAYAFSRMRFRSKSAIMMFVLFFQMVSPLVVCIPLFFYFGRLGLTNNLGAILVVYIALSVPMASWNLKGYLDTIPYEIDEAATIDGCSRLGILIRIHMPTATPGIVSVMVVTMVSMWSQFIVPFILLNNAAKFPVSVAVVNLQSTAESIKTHYLAAGCVISILPTAIIFIFLQRFIVSSMTAGAVKG